MRPATDTLTGCQRDSAARDKQGGTRSALQPITRPRWKSLSPRCRAVLRSVGIALLVTQVLQAGCGPQHEYVPIRLDLNDASLRILDDVRLGSPDGPDIDRIGVQREVGTYYDAVWQRQTVDLRQTPILHQRVRPAYVASIVVPSVLGFAAIISGLIGGFMLACSSPGSCSIGVAGGR